MNRTPQIAIVDFGLSNLYSVIKACQAAGLKVIQTSDPDKLTGMDGAILPGMGAFGTAMDNMNRSGLTDAVQELVKAGKPLFGVCLGLQLMLDDSDEFGVTTGLGLIPGRVRHLEELNSEGQTERIPTIGWKKLIPNGSWNGTPLQEMTGSDMTYFVHTFYALPNNSDDSLALSLFSGREYSAVLHRDNLFATQFHPEKSGPKGLTIYQSWYSQNF